MNGDQKSFTPFQRKEKQEKKEAGKGWEREGKAKKGEESGKERQPSVPGNVFEGWRRRQRSQETKRRRSTMRLSEWDMFR